jgi:P-type E1-E2 ATPase
MALSAGIEGHSEHPIAKAIADDASARGVKAKRVKNPRTIEGQGLAGELKVNDALVAVAIGNQRLLDARGIAVDDDAIAAAAAQDDGLFVTSGDSVIGFIVVDDAVRDDANAAVAALQAAHLGTQLLSGDRQRTAERIGRRLGIGTIRAEVSPKDKLDVIEDLAKAGHVAFVGDGVNDAAALARATVGIGMGGGGSDVAVAAADVALMRPRLMLVPELIALATRTRRIMLQNLGWAFGYNLVMLPLAAGLLSSWGLVLSPILASVAMSLSSVSVVMNSVRLTSHRMRGGEA